MISIRTVQNRSDLKDFIRFPYQLYRGNPYWAPPLIRDEFRSFSPEHNPALEFCAARLFIAEKDQRKLGRIAAIMNYRENETLTDPVARFGWVDFVDDIEVSKRLFTAAEQWASQQGAKIFKGPYGFSNMDKTGLLIDGFHELSTMAVIYNYPYYPRHLDNLGYSALVDYEEFEIKVPDQVPDRIDHFARMIGERYQLYESIPENKDDLVQTGRDIFHLINRAYEHLEGFIPHTDTMIEYFVQKYTALLNPDFISVVRDKEHQLAGFGISMPSLTKALQKARGKLLPLGWYHLKRALQRNDRADLYLIAVRPDLQNKGVTALIFSKLIRTCLQYGIKKVETNPELRSNQEVQNLWKGYDMRKHKARRCYSKPL